MAKKNANGDGMRPRKRKDGRWEARIWINGKVRSVYGKTRGEVTDKVKRLLTNQDTQAPEDNSVVTFAEFIHGQYDAVALHSMKTRGYEAYRDIARNHLLPAFRTSPVQDLTRAKVQRFYGEKSEQGLSAASVRRIHGVLAAVLAAAVKWGVVEENVCDLVTKPRVPQPEIRPFSKEEARRFLEAARGDRYEALYMLGITSGARWGELSGLYWSDIDLDSRRMNIQRALVCSHGRYTFEEPKTKGSRRSVQLSRIATQSLVRHKQNARGELVFTNTIGNPIHQSNFIRRNFKPLLRRANLPDTNWHAATRHTCTCILLLEGVNPTSVAMQMGWSSVAFMLEQYARFLPGWGDTGAIDDALG